MVEFARPLSPPTAPAICLRAQGPVILITEESPDGLCRPRCADKQESKTYTSFSLSDFSPLGALLIWALQYGKLFSIHRTLLRTLVHAGFQLAGQRTSYSLQVIFYLSKNISIYKHQFS